MNPHLDVVTAYDDARFEDNFPPGIEDHYWFAARNAVLHRTLVLLGTARSPR